MSQSQILEILPASFAICRFPSDAPLPVWWETLPFCSISRTDDELSIICVEQAVPVEVACSRGWMAFKVRGPFALDAIGVLSALTRPLADNYISMMAVSTYETDYILVKRESLDAAIAAFEADGHAVIERPA
jgi:hypothetical protein